MADITIPRDRLGTITADGSVFVSKSWLRFFMQLTAAVNAAGGTTLIGDDASIGLIYPAIDDAVGAGSNFFLPEDAPAVINNFNLLPEALISDGAPGFLQPFDVPSEVKAQPVSVSPGASPATLTATSNGWYIVSGGTLSALDYSRAGGSFISLGVLAGMFQVSSGDAIKITYTVVPTVYFVPR